MSLAEHLPNLNKKHLVKAGITGLILFSSSFGNDGSNTQIVCYEYRGSYTRSTSDTPEFLAKKTRCLNAGTKPGIFTCSPRAEIKLASKSSPGSKVIFQGKLVRCMIEEIPPKST